MSQLVRSEGSTDARSVVCPREGVDTAEDVDCGVWRTVRVWQRFLQCQSESDYY